jgi:hypothetical protein
MILCDFFGHRMGYGRMGGGDYGDVIGGNVDGIGREHYKLFVRCCRCGVRFHAGSFHGPLKHDALTQYYNDRINGAHAAKAP